MIPVKFFTSSKDVDVTITGTPVAVSVTFNRTGDFIPILFCFEEEGELYKFKIESVDYIKNLPGVVSFSCSYIYYDRIRKIVLNFYNDRHLWTITY